MKIIKNIFNKLRKIFNKKKNLQLKKLIEFTKLREEIKRLDISYNEMINSYFEKRS